MHHLIGDIHGYAGPLQQLLKKLGYWKLNDENFVWVGSRSG